MPLSSPHACSLHSAPRPARAGATRHSTPRVQPQLHSPQRACSCRPAPCPARAVAAPLLAPRAQSPHRPLHASPASPSAPLNDPALQPCSPLREPDSGSTRTTPRLCARPRSPSREPGPASTWPSQATVSSLDLCPQLQRPNESVHQ